jgi:hypothetical protein
MRVKRTTTCACCGTENRTTGTVFIGAETLKLCAYCLSLKLQKTVDLIRQADALAWLTRL